MITEALCKAFCDELAVTQVPAGLAVKTAFTSSDGDAMGFYITRHPSQDGLHRLEDSGLMVPGLEAAGVNLSSGTRAVAFQRLLGEYGCHFDDLSMEIRSEYVEEASLAAEAIRFVALLLRVQDLELLAVETVENTFREDVTTELHRTFDQRATLQFRVPPLPDLSEFEADAVVSRDQLPPLAIYLATTEARVDEAVMLWMEKRYKKLGVSVALVLENERPAQISNRALRRAMNRLEATTVFGNDSAAAMDRLSTMIGLGSDAIQ